MENPKKNNLITPRVRNYWANILLVLFSSLAIIWQGPELFINEESPSTYKFTLYTITAMLFVAMVFITHKSKGNTILTGIFRSIIIGAISIGFAFLFGNFIQTKTGTLNQEIAELLNQGNMLIEDGEFSGALALGEKCAGIAVEPLDAKECYRLVANSTYELGKKYMENSNCSQAMKTLTQSINAAEKVGDHDLIEKITNRRLAYEDNNCKEIFVPTDTPVPDHFMIEFLNKHKGSTTSKIDFRVINNNVFIKDLIKENFILTNVNDEKINTDFSFKSADDPVCIVAVVDNSGSIKAGIEEMKNAILELNKFRKPDDRYGMVVFGNDEKTNIIQLPQRKDLSINEIDGQNDTTALWKGIELGFNAIESCDSNSDRYIILITDGTNTEPYDLSNNKAIEHFKDLAINNEISFCPIGVSSESLDPDQLKQLAEDCTYLEASNWETLVSKISSIVGYVRNFYRLSFSTKDLSVSEVVTFQLLKDGQPVGEKIDVECGN